MTFMRRPRVFMSYRHEEMPRGPDAQRYNELHRTWVTEFARAVASWNVDVIWDDRLRDLFRPHVSVDPGALPFLAEASTLCLEVAQVFMPVITRGYLERILAESDTPAYGTVTEEWLRGIRECAAGRAEVVAIVREWPISGYPTVPAPITSQNSWDYRFVSPDRDEVELLCDSLHGIWKVERPPFDMSFTDLISQYLKFCANAFDLPWPGVEKWGCQFGRPRVFLDFVAEMAAIGPAGELAGSDRDVQEFMHAFGSRLSHSREGAKRSAALGSREEKKAEEAAKKLARSVFETHLARYRRPFDFTAEAPGGRSSSGLHFGPTQPPFSYLHESDPRRPE